MPRRLWLRGPMHYREYCGQGPAPCPAAAAAPGPRTEPFRAGPAPHHGGSGHCGRSRRPPRLQHRAPFGMCKALHHSGRLLCRCRGGSAGSAGPATSRERGGRAGRREAPRTRPRRLCIPFSRNPLAPRRLRWVGSVSRSGRPVPAGRGRRLHCVVGRGAQRAAAAGAALAAAGATGPGGSVLPLLPPVPFPPTPSALPLPELHQTALRFLLILQRQEMARVCSLLLCIQQPARSCHTRPAPASCCCCCRDEPRPTPGMRLQDCGSLTSPQPPLPRAELLFPLS